MSSNHNNSHKPLPLSEDQLCDWIDGNLSDEQVSRMLAASGRSDLNDRVAQMQLQKAALASLPVERAPRDLHDRTLAALEREMLLGAVEAERSSNGSTPSLRLVSDPDATSLAKARSERTRKALPGFAMAAGLLLVVGGTTYFVAQTISLSKKPLASPSIAHNTAPATTPSDSQGTTEIAMNDANPEGAALMKAEGDVPGAAMKRSAGTSFASEVREEPSQPVTVALDRAAELASEGRLAIRVLSDDLSGLKTFEQVGSNGVQKAWRVQKDVPAQVVASVLPAAFPGGANESVMNDPRMLASEIVTPLAGFGAAFGSNIFASSNAGDYSPISRVRASYLVTVPASESGLDVLRTTLRNRLRGAVEFIELPAAVTTQAADNARDALWWMQAPNQWTPKATIPLLVAKP